MSEYRRAQLKAIALFPHPKITPEAKVQQPSIQPSDLDRGAIRPRLHTELALRKAPLHDCFPSIPTIHPAAGNRGTEWLPGRTDRQLDRPYPSSQTLAGTATYQYGVS